MSIRDKTEVQVSCDTEHCEAKVTFVDVPMDQYQLHWALDGLGWFIDNTWPGKTICPNHHPERRR